MPEKKELTGRRKAAILLVILGPDKAAQVLKHLDDETVEQLTIREVLNTQKKFWKELLDRRKQRRS